jgi:acetylornithine deacetylase/succinyl-diaminopimelate desuccinylase-like protein
VDWDRVRDEAIGHLGELIRICTINPPGGETAACQYLASVLSADGIEPRLIEAAPGRGNLIARLAGDGTAPPLLLMAHLDVVPVEADQWTCDPFGGQIRRGYLYGRGALDTKDLVAMELGVLLLLKRERVPLRRDVIFMANADEEMGGHLGARHIVEHYPELIRAEYAINEGGGFGTTILGKRVYSVQTAEKGTARFTLRARGRPGHASVPQRDTAVLRLARALDVLGNSTLPAHVTATAALYIGGLANAVGGSAGGALRGLLDGKNSAQRLERLPLDEGLRGMLYAMLHNTATPTRLNAGHKINVIPSVAEAQVDGRILPGQTPQMFLNELRGVLGSSCEIDFHQPTTPGIESEPGSPLFDTIVRVLRRHDPAAVLLPELVVGATDARHVTRLGTRVYGFCPMFDHSSEMERVHGHDERISLDNVGFGTRVLAEVVCEFAGAPGGMA